MKVLFLCGVFAKENTDEVVQHARRAVEFSANLFQEKLINGFKDNNIDVQVLSAPFIGSYPNASDIPYFSGFSEVVKDYTYVSFSNLWGWRNFSRAAALKKALNDFISLDDEKKLIVAYSAHTPFLEAAAYAKKKDKRIKVCLYVPDLPNYMNLSADRSKFYDIAKKFDIASMERYMEQVDAYVLLTEQMKMQLPIGEKPYIVKEGIVDHFPDVELTQGASYEKYIVYTGKLDRKFGILDLLRAFEKIPNGEYRLVLCGRGDCDDEAARYAAEDSRIICTGQITPEQAKEWQQKAAVLVNPRQNNEEYTKYSFPSKNTEYLLSGKPVVAVMLDGIPVRYRDFIFEISQQGLAEDEIAKALMQAIETKPEIQAKKYQAFLSYANNNLTSGKIVQELIQLCFKK